MHHRLRSGDVGDVPMPQADEVLDGRRDAGGVVDAERHVLRLDRIEQFFDRRLDDKFGLRVYLFGDLLPELGAEAGKLAALFIDERFDETGCDAKFLLFRLGKGERNDQNEKRHKQQFFHLLSVPSGRFQRSIQESQLKITVRLRSPLGRFHCCLPGRDSRESGG